LGNEKSSELFYCRPYYNSAEGGQLKILGKRNQSFSHLKQPKPPVDLHWFFEISIRTEKKFKL